MWRYVSLASRGKGFTLLELLLVLTLLSLLAGLAAPVVSGAIVRAKEAALRENLLVMRSALDDYFADNGRYPEDLGDLVENRYIRFVPEDPLIGNADSWVATHSDIEAGIENIYSSSTAVAQDGSYYSDW